MEPLAAGTAFTARRRHQPVLMALPEPMSSTFGGSRSSTELLIVIAQPQRSISSESIALTLVNQPMMPYVLPIELSAERLGLAATSAPDYDLLPKSRTNGLRYARLIYTRT